MQHDFLELDEFVAEASKTAKDKIREIQILPMQESGLQLGCWALRLDGLREGMNPLAWKIEVFYIYDRQDFIATAAMEGGDADEMFAEAQECYNNGTRRGRAYDPEHLSGRLCEYPAYELLPISEEEAQQVQLFEFRVPVIFGMCDWFEPLIDQAIEEMTTSGLGGGAEPLPCPSCGDKQSVRAIAAHNATGVFRAVRTETGYALLSNDATNVLDISHLHLVCGNEECDYDQCVDLNENEIDISHL